jgi:hypothetical protein
MNETLNSIRNRPRFKLYTNLSPDEYEVNLRKYLDENRDRFYGNINREVATIFVKTEDENYGNRILRLESKKKMT